MATILRPAAYPADERVVLHDVRWELYDMLRRELGNRQVRLTYDGRNLEIMSPSRGHDLAGRFLGRLIAALANELDVEIGTGGSTTFRRDDIHRGLEPDECFWIANESAVRGKREIDLTIDPPPDLAIEIDISPSPLDRAAVYAALHIPEVWRFDGQNLYVEILGNDDRYHPSEKSLSYPSLSVAELPRFIAMAEREGEVQALRSFVQWLREQDV